MIEPLSWAMGEDELGDLRTNRRKLLSMWVKRDNKRYELRVALPHDIKNGTAWDVVCEDSCENHEWLDLNTMQIARYHQDRTEFIWIDNETGAKTSREIGSLRSIEFPKEGQ